MHFHLYNLVGIFLVLIWVEERVPLLYTSPDVLNNALHHLNHLHAPYVLPLYTKTSTNDNSSQSES